MSAWKVGIIGSGFISEVHNNAFKQIPDVEVVGIATLEPKSGRRLCRKFGIPNMFSDYRDLLKMKQIDMVTVGVPNYLHARFAIDAAKAGKHVVVEKPLALSLEDADRMIETAEKAGVILGYAEELCYIPKFVHAKKIADQGAVGRIFYVKQCEKHAGPYSPWFFTVKEAGGGILMDMGCHAIEFCRWFMGKPRVTGVYAHMDKVVHLQGEVEDHVIMHMEFEGGATALVESSWTLKGGMSSTMEAHGTEGVIYSSLLQEGMGMEVFSEKGFGPDKKETKGWSEPEWEWSWQNGYPHEMTDFVDAARTGRTPVESGIDGRAVLEIMLAGYHSAAIGEKVALPFKPPRSIKRPVELWLRGRNKKSKKTKRS